MRSRSTRTTVGLVAVLAALAAASGRLQAPGPAAATASFTLTRLQGTDRYDTARVIAGVSFGSADTALLATGVQFADALAAAFLAGNRAAPILLTAPGSLSPPTKQALADLKVRNVTILGGPAAVSAAVEDELRRTESTAAAGGALAVTRLGGTDRYDTAARIATTAGLSLGTPNGRRTALLATGDRFADALAAAPGAYAGKLPLLLTPGAPSSTLHPAARTALEALGIEHVLVLGGSAAVATAVEDQVRNARGPASITTERLQGTNRTATALAIASYEMQALNFVSAHVTLARGDDPAGFADALAGGPHAGIERTPVLLTPSPSELGHDNENYLHSLRNFLNDGHLFGGPSAVSDAVKAAAESAARGDPPAGPDGTPGRASMVRATVHVTTGKISVFYSEPVTCIDDAATRAQFGVRSGLGSMAVQSVACDGSATLVLTLGGTLSERDYGVQYLDPNLATDADDVKSLDGVQAKVSDGVSPNVYDGGTIGVATTTSTTAPPATTAYDGNWQGGAPGVSIAFTVASNSMTFLEIVDPAPAPCHTHQAQAFYLVPVPLSGTSFTYLKPSPPDPEMELVINFTSPTQASGTLRVVEKDNADCAPRTVAWSGQKG